MVMNFFILIFGAVPYWSLVEFNKSTFITGLWGSIINAVAINFIKIAQKLGPLGPVAAIAAMYSPLLVIVEALKQNRMISLLELVGVVLGTYGALLMVVPKFF